MNKACTNQEVQTDNVFIFTENPIKEEKKLEIVNGEVDPSLLNKPVPNSNFYYNLPLNLQGGSINEEKFRDYHMRLNKLLSVHKRK